jgi:signal transduction histidine kinase
MKNHTRTISYFFAILAVAAIFFSLEFITEKYFYPNDEIVDILAAIIGALSFARCKRFFDSATDQIFFRAERDVHAEFLTNISHELQTPIAILRGNVEVLQRTCITEAERASAERVIVVTLDGMSRLIGDVLESAKLKFSKKIFHGQEVAVKILLDEAREDFLLLAEDKNICLSVSAEDSVSLHADRGKLKEVLLNLISNALKHTPRGGSVVLRVARKGITAQIVVEDSGPGIPPDELPHIFERFYRIRNGCMTLADSGVPVAPSVPSTGIGLNICREIIEAHGGTITAESEAGRGSRFTISLPSTRRLAPTERAIHALSAIINQ